MKYSVAWYRKHGAMRYVNGARLIVTEQEYVIKNLFFTVARFAIDKTQASKIPYENVPKMQGIRLSDAEKAYELYCKPKVAASICALFGI